MLVLYIYIYIYIQENLTRLHIFENVHNNREIGEKQKLRTRFTRRTSWGVLCNYFGLLI